MNKKVLQLLKSPYFIFIIIILLSVLLFFIWFPSASQVRGCLKTKMFSVDLCPTSKQYVPLNHISKYLQNALILTEDSNFYQHNGFDEAGIEHCLEKLKSKGRIVCGGSTITQQLAKNMFLNKDKNFLRKGLEALITIKLESTLSKKEILERYLNVVQFGKNIFGVKQAAQFYFKKNPAQLSILESAFLVMVLPNPVKYSQSYYRKDLTKFARRRLNRIVNDMYKYKRIGDAEYLTAQDGLDYFFKTGQVSEHAQTQTDELTIEDLNEMTADDSAD